MIIKVVKWSNGMVMVFDQYGRQLPEFQGEWYVMKNKIKRYANRFTKFYKGDWQEQVEEVTKEEIFNEAQPS